MSIKTKKKQKSNNRKRQKAKKKKKRRPSASENRSNDDSGFDFIAYFTNLYSGDKTDSEVEDKQNIGINKENNSDDSKISIESRNSQNSGSKNQRAPLRGLAQNRKNIMASLKSKRTNRELLLDDLEEK